MKIGLISDTHGFLDETIFRHFRDCEEIWHAGDMGEIALMDQLVDFKPVRGVYGNIDGQDVRVNYPENEIFECRGMKILMTHIAGSPPRYNARVRGLIKSEQPQVLVCGHSHILRVVTDQANGNLLYLNPGAAGRQGFHKTRTILRFDITEKGVTNMQVIELGSRGK